MSVSTAPTYDELLKDNERLRARVAELESQLKSSSQASISITSPPVPVTSSSSSSSSVASLERKWTSSLSSDAILRYSRQLLISEVGVAAQGRFTSSRVLIVGAGGLGAPIALYLAAAGIGKLGIVDGDEVELNNLHRQVIHSEATLAQPKAISARDACRRLNSSINIEAHVERFDESNAMELVRQYDIIVDATDNVATRYLINDSAILNKKVVVSGSALRMEGQVTVYGYKGGPCYRCLYPTPPPPETVTNCSDGGVLGIVPGIIGCLQALEILKIAGGLDAEILSQRLLLFDAMNMPMFRVFKLRTRDVNCAVCGDKPTVTGLINYTQFCSSGLHDKPVIGIDGAVGASDVSLSARHIADQRSSSSTSTTTTTTNNDNGHILLDVRVPEQYNIASLPGAINIPLRDLKKRYSELQSIIADKRSTLTDSKTTLPIYVLCRRGVDSMTATRLLRSLRDTPSTTAPSSSSTTTTDGNTTPTPPTTASSSNVKHNEWEAWNMSGGLLAWARHVDPSFPVY